MARKPVMTNWQIGIRVTLLIGAFVGVITTMRGLKQNSALDRFFTGVSSGVNPNKSQIETAHGVLNLCPTRVARIEILDHGREKKLSFFQKGIKWIMEGESAAEIPPLLMEKWLSLNCRVQIDKVTSSIESVEQQLKVQYIDGTQQSFSYGHGRFASAVGVFESQQLQSALNQLNP